MKQPILDTYHVNEVPYRVLERYEVTKFIGNGGYGTVIEAFDKVLKRKVAIKKIPINEKPPVTLKRLLREIRIMKHLKGHPNIVTLFDLIPPANFKDFTDVYIVMEYMESDLKQLLKSKQPIDDKNVQYFLYNILCGLRYVHSAQILHRDLKPENILLNKEMEVKLCDFGLSRAIEQELDNGHATQYVATRYYRSPELLLYWGTNTKALDLWSVGCILGELYQKGVRIPLFPGQDYKGQVTLIIKSLGTPKDEEIKGCESAKKFVKSLPTQVKKEWKKKFPNANADGLDLLDKLLQFDPTLRISADEAIKHDYLKEMYDPDDPEQMKTCDKPFDKIDEDITEEKLKEDKDLLKKLLYDEIMVWNLNENNLEGDARISDVNIKV